MNTYMLRRLQYVSVLLAFMYGSTAASQLRLPSGSSSSSTTPVRVPTATPPPLPPKPVQVVPAPPLPPKSIQPVVVQRPKEEDFDDETPKFRKQPIKGKKPAVPNPLNASISQIERLSKDVKDAKQREINASIVQSLRIINRRLNVHTRKMRTAGKKKKAHMKKPFRKKAAQNR